MTTLTTALFMGKPKPARPSMTDYARGMGVKIIAASALLLLTACGSPGGNSVSEPATSTTAAMTTLSPATPQYSVIGTTAMSTMRYDGEPIYYVAMDPVNLTNDGFKQNVKLVLVEPYFDLKTPNSIGRATGAEVLVMPPSVGGVKDVTDYFTLFDYDINLLIGALKKVGTATH